MTVDQIKALIVPLIGTGIFSKREEIVLRLRWVDGKTLQESGAALDVARERIRQIEANAFRKYRKAGVANAARDVIAAWKLPMYPNDVVRFTYLLERLNAALEFCNRE